MAEKVRKLYGTCEGSNRNSSSVERETFHRPEALSLSFETLTRWVPSFLQARTHSAVKRSLVQQGGSTQRDINAGTSVRDCLPLVSSACAGLD